MAYGLSQPLINEAQPPIVSTRNPTTNDKALIGTSWVNTSSNEAFILTSIVSNSATWESISGGSGTFSSLTVTTGPVSLAGITTLGGTLALSSTGPQVLFGAGAPSISAPQGSLYLNTTGNSTSTRAYINTNGTTGWTAITTAT